MDDPHTERQALNRSDYHPRGHSPRARALFLAPQARRIDPLEPKAAYNLGNALFAAGATPWTETAPKLTNQYRKPRK